MPAQGEIVTQYGEVARTTAGRSKAIAPASTCGADGPAALAPARGRVALIDQVRLRGNIVVLDHGLGVFTTYAHLSAVDVQVGQEVQAGQPFAKVGSTGLLEGPHLHWELWVRGVNVDPLEWTTRSFPWLRLSNGGRPDPDDAPMTRQMRTSQRSSPWRRVTRRRLIQGALVASAGVRLQRDSLLPSWRLPPPYWPDRRHCTRDILMIRPDGRDARLVLRPATASSSSTLAVLGRHAAGLRT